MAKDLSFVVGGIKYSAEPTKIERRKIYGWTETRASSVEKGDCRQVSLDSTGTTIIPSGATKLGMLREDGKWMDKGELQTQHADGTQAEIVPSSFDHEIELLQKVNEEYLLDHLISSVYQLSGDGAEALAKALGNDCYAFVFNYRADYKGESAVILSNGTTPFIYVGEMAVFNMIGLEDQSSIDETEEEVQEEVEDLDFSMF